MNLDVLEDADDAAGRGVLLVSGSLDFDSRPALITAGQETLDRDDTEGLVLDLAQVQFLDSTGIGAFVQLAQHAEDADKTFGIRNPSARVARVLSVAGLAEQWAVDDAD